MAESWDILVIGGGIVGLSVAERLLSRHPTLKILLIEKEAAIATHASGRNSGVLHAGFYYSADSLKARFCVEGNRLLREFCSTHKLPINECGKLVVAMDEGELRQLHELKDRGERNGCNVRLIAHSEALKIQPKVFTYQEALYSPSTATVDPNAIASVVARLFVERGGSLRTGVYFQSVKDGKVLLSSGEIDARHIVNCAGLYADKIAQQFGKGLDYTIIPFKGLYLKYTKNKTDVVTNIYPVPNLKQPFLGVHFTITVDGTIKIGPTAIPAFWRENYQGFERFKLGEVAAILSEEAKLFIANSFNFRDLAFEEMKKYDKSYFVNLAKRLVPTIDPAGFTEFSKPGIRAQLLNKKTRELTQDFIVEGDKHSTHVLNAVSPAFTCSFPFADHIIEKFVEPAL